jgi:hypothetical protein
MTSERGVVRIIEGSAVVRAVDRLFGRIGAAARRSRALSKVAAELDDGRTRPGAVVLTAVVTHLILMIAVARPPAGYWLILPMIYAAAGLLLLFAVDLKAWPRD